MNTHSINLSEHEQNVKKLAIDLTHDMASFLSDNSVDKSILLTKIINTLSRLLDEPIIIRNNHSIVELLDDDITKVHHLNNIFELLLLTFSALQSMQVEDRTEASQIKWLYEKIERTYTLLTQTTGLEGWDKIINDGTIELRKSIQEHIGDLLGPISRLLPSLLEGLSIQQAIQSGKDIVTKLELRITGDYNENTHNGEPMNFRKGDREGIRDIIKRINELLNIAENKESNMKGVAGKLLDLRILVENILDTNPHL